MPPTKSLKILLADDEAIIRQTLGNYLRDTGQTVEEAPDGLAAWQMIQLRDYDLVLVDLRMPGLDGLGVLARVRESYPDLPVVLITAHGNLDVAVQALRLGAADLLVKPIKLLELDAVVEKAMRLQKLASDGARLRSALRNIQGPNTGRGGRRRFIGVSQAAENVRGQIRLAAEKNLDTILITGETGTGKEVAAREIHFLAGSDDSPFITVSCPALPDTLVESELFGHVKGSFTGATATREGCFEMADGGTLFLDEVGDLSPQAQAKLLRATETRMFRRVGGSKEISVNIRVIAATNLPLFEMMESGDFRRDLYYRLGAYTIDLPPLRERTDDIIPLAEHFLENFARLKGLAYHGLSQSATHLLQSYDYPGNARELKHLVERAAILNGTGLILPEYFNLRPTPLAGAAPPSPFPLPIIDEKTRITQALESNRWNRRLAAKALCMPLFNAKI